jgi:hypothetical protein
MQKLVDERQSLVERFGAEISEKAAEEGATERGV